MIPVYAHEPFPDRVIKSIFLAGPTPRSDDTVGWRQEALKLLSDMGYDGHIFIPEPRDGAWLSNYDMQVEWEEEGLNRADCILFWVPRELKSMPGLTTNIEWGMWQSSGKVVWAAPDRAVNVRYPTYYAKKLGVPTATDLGTALRIVIDRLGLGEARQHAECQVPLHIWQKKEFQSWLKSQYSVGNRLNSARVLFSTRNLFSYVVHVSVHVASEGRNKENEIIVARPDVSAVVLHSWHPDRHARVVLVREFRSAVNNPSGFVHELPGGSSASPDSSSLETAVAEVAEEVGLRIDPLRFKYHGFRQLNSTLLIHGCHLYSCLLTQEELDIVTNDHLVHGADDMERTYLEVKTVDEIVKSGLVDWSNVGMIVAALT